MGTVKGPPRFSAMTLRFSAMTFIKEKLDTYRLLFNFPAVTEETKKLVPRAFSSVKASEPGADPGFVFRRWCTRLLLYFNTSKPHSFFFFFLAEY